MLWLMPGLLGLTIVAMVYLPRLSRPFEAMLERMGVPTQEANRRTQCQSNLYNVSMAIAQYAQDYDQRLPSATSNPSAYGWADALNPYVGSSAFLHCPKNANVISINPSSVGYTDYYFNSNCLDGSLPSAPDSSHLILIGEGPPSDARSARSGLPPAWIAQGDSPARLHFPVGEATNGGANYIFADGHIKWLRSESIDSPSVPSNSVPTFALPGVLRGRAKLPN